MARPVEDLTGQRFGRLLILRRCTAENYVRPYWVCKCDCGAEVSRRGSRMIAGHTRSCGCLQKEEAATKHKTHGHALGRRSPTYRTWQSMITRCTNKNHQAYHNYGGRGIIVCDRWLDFENFLADMGERPGDKTLDRINNDEGYGPGNCKWSTKEEQSNNQRTNVILVHKGVSKTLTEWAKSLDMSVDVLWKRFNISKWSVEKP